jgi:tetracycline resistance efflux pump
VNELAFGWLSIVPPLVAILLAILSRQVVLSLLAGVWAGWLIMAGGNLLAGTRDTVDALLAVFGETWQTRVILFTLLMGSLLILMQRSGGIEGFVRWVEQWRWARSRTGAQLMAWVLGLGVFIESTITCLVVGTVSRPLFDRLRISREKLAYICDSTSAPVCMLLPINSWGALVLALLGAQAVAGNLGEAGTVTVFLQAVALNFYSWGAILLVLMICLTGRDFGPMKEAERRAREEGKVLRDGAQPVVDESVVAQEIKAGVTPRLRNMLVPLLVLVAMVPAGIAITGIAGVRDEGLLEAGFFDYLNQASGTAAVLWAVLAALLTAVAMLTLQRVFTVREATDLAFRGAGGMLPLAALMMLAFAIGMVSNQMGTGAWVAQAVEPYLNARLIAPLVFIVAGFVAFSTGTSWGTMAIMIPLAVPLAANFQVEGAFVSTPLVVSAVLGGAVFGDHCSPISDTTVVASMASCSDHIDHVRTQLPYALLVGVITVGIYLVVGTFA